MAPYDKKYVCQKHGSNNQYKIDDSFLQFREGNMTGITQWEKLLGEDFVRVHRSYVVKKSAIVSVANESVSLQDGTEIPVSRKYRDIINNPR